MSASSRRFSSRSKPSEANENELVTPLDPIPPSISRSPLNPIQDPSQNPSEGPPHESFSTKADASDSKQRLADNHLLSIKGIGAIPKSAQSTPARVVSRVHHGIGSVGTSSGSHSTQYMGIRERGGSSRVSRGVLDAKFCDSVQVPHFELNEDPSFWKDRNVQVLIRVRPISGAESILQGCRRCLMQESSQTLTWAGHPETRFTFDHIACETMSQEKLFQVVGLPMVENCMSGYNSCMFAYGQTGSGKTYTMMGEIHEIDNSLIEDRGMTPRIFECLFTRIREEEVNRSAEQLKYSCKCSFLEIYNEQITDLLEPSSINLQLREDMKRGVYVENLKEYEVSSVKDVVQLLLQGTANRKMAATHMNSESSRSHSVLTCVIESRWEKDSMTHRRFGRLNLVDLAGSERQKSSGAEGERLKEAANINRSLSTLGLVIMTLVDIANGKNRHVPYRDSRLTFLLQDSLGGNSKTTIIANVSPSICSASETLSTLKFAQRAKLIQNNAKVNEDASGDVMALQRQIQQLKDQLTSLIKHQNVPRPLCHPSPCLEKDYLGDFHDDCDFSLERSTSDDFNNPSLLNQKMKYLEATSTGALRREKMAEAAVRRLEAEVDCMSRLVHEREDDAERTKMMLRFREEKLRRLELLADDLVSSDGYLMEENIAQAKEIQLLRARIDRNPELTRFALENMRLLEQLRMFQDFYQQGEREALLAEVSVLRNQLLEVLEGKFAHVNGRACQGDDTIQELDSCRRQLGSCLEDNARLTREIDDLRCQLKLHLSFEETTYLTDGDTSGVDHRIQETNKQSSVELTFVGRDSEAGIESCDTGDRAANLNTDMEMGDAVPLQFNDVPKKLMDARLLVASLESEQVQLITDLDILRQENCRYLEPLSGKVHDEADLRKKLEPDCLLSEGLRRTPELSPIVVDHTTECRGTAKSALHTKLEKILMDIKEARMLNRQLQYDNASQSSRQHDMEQFWKHDEAETVSTIPYLQEELATLQQEVDSRSASQLFPTMHSMLLMTKNEELNDRLCSLTQENVKLSDLVAARDSEISSLANEWEKAIIDLTSFLVHGCKSLEDASNQIESVVDSFPQRNVWINEHVERAIKVFIEKEKLIANLQKKLGDAQRMGLEMKLKLNYLRGATLAITEVQQLENDENFKELFHLRKLLSEKISKIHELENDAKCKEDHITEAEKRANAAFIVIKMLYDMNTAKSLDAEVAKSLITKHANKKSQISENQARDCDATKSEVQIYPIDAQSKDAVINSLEMNLPLSINDDSVVPQDLMANGIIHALEELRVQDGMAMRRVLESDITLYTFYADTEKYLSALLSDIHATSSAVKILFQDSTNGVCAINKKFRELKEEKTTLPLIVGESPSFRAGEVCKVVNQSTVMQNIVDELVKANEKLTGLKAGFDSLFLYGKITKQEHEIVPRMESQKLQISGDSLIHCDAIVHSMMEKADIAMNALIETCSQLSVLLDDKGYAVSPAVRTDNLLSDTVHKYPSDQLRSMEFCQILQTLERRMEEADAGCSKTREILHFKLNDARLVAEEKTKQAKNLLLKFEEAQETMKEADLMLNSLLEANENVKHERDWWKHASEKLLTEKTALVEEMKRLEISTISKEQQYGVLQDQICASLEKLLDSTASVSGSFRKIQSTEEELNATFSDMFSFGHELLECIGTSRSWLEDMMFEIMEEGFALSVLYQCHMAAFLEQIRSFSLHSGSTHSRLVEFCSGLCNAVNPYKEVGLYGTIFMAVKDREKEIQNHFNHEHSSLGDTEEVLNAFQAAQQVTTSISNYGKPDLADDQECLLKRITKLEKDNLDLIHDTKLVEDAITNLAICLDKFVQEFASHGKVSEGSNLPAGTERTEIGATSGQSSEISIATGASSSAICKDPGLDFIQDDTVGIEKSENGIHNPKIVGVVTDVEVLITGIQHLKTNCAQLIAFHMSEKNHAGLPLCHVNAIQDMSINVDKYKPKYGQEGEMGLWKFSETTTEYGNQSIQALYKLGSNLNFIIGEFHSALHVEIANRSYDSLLETLFQGICSAEEKTKKFLSRSSEYAAKQADVITENLLLNRELARKDVVLEGLLFDLRLLQESTSNVKDMKDEAEGMVASLTQVEHELAFRIAQIENIFVQKKMLEAQLADSEAALSNSKSEHELAQEKMLMLWNENTELKLLLENVYVKRTHAEQQLEDNMMIVKGSEKEITPMSSSVKGKILSVGEIVDELRGVSDERDHLRAEIVYLNDKLDMANALADENEAVAVEARQVAEASKVYAEQKEEEVKILEHSVEELEATINVLEQKVYDMREEVESYQLIRKGLELEVQTLTQRILTVENAAGNLNTEESDVKGRKSQIPRQMDHSLLELYEARRHIDDLESERANQAEEIKQYREHISELVLHSEAQSSLYQEKFKALENMVSEANTGPSTSNPVVSIVNQTEKSSVRTRGSGSPFKCIASIVQQMNSEKDQELSVARLQIEELEALAASRQKEVCMLTTRLAVVESMTHDVIRDLLGVKLDMTNYANLIDQEQLQKLLDNAHQQTEEFHDKEQEILNLKKQIDGLIQERSCWIEEINQRKADVLASQVMAERLQQRNQLLTAQNEMLKMDKTNLHQKIAELDESVKILAGSQSIHEQLQQPTANKESSCSRVGSEELSRRLAQSDKLLSHVKNDRPWCRKSNGKNPFDHHL